MRTKEKRTTLFYKPEIYKDDDTNIEWVRPDELQENDAFASYDDAAEFMDSIGYSVCEINVVRLVGEEGDYRILGPDGKPVEE